MMLPSNSECSQYKFISITNNFNFLTLTALFENNFSLYSVLKPNFSHRINIWDLFLRFSLLDQFLPYLQCYSQTYYYLLLMHN